MPKFGRMAAASLAGLVIREASGFSQSLSDLCTLSNVKNALPSNSTISGVEFDLSSVTAAVANYTASSSGRGGVSGGMSGGVAGGSSQASSVGAPASSSLATSALGVEGSSSATTPGMKGSASAAASSSASTSAASFVSTLSTSSLSSTTQYCNVTLAYTHNGRGDTVNLVYAFPDPKSYANRFYVGGGGGYSLNSDATDGLAYGAVSGATDAGYDAFNYSMDEKILLGNGSVNWQVAHMFGYQALGELTKIGKYVTPRFYGLQNDTKVFTYFSGCSDGGREAMSQVQRWSEEYDGVVAGAPAFRFAQQQVLHVFPATIEAIKHYYPPPCALQKIVNATIDACDPLDGRTDGVIGRSDLCKLHFNLDSVIGKSYHCAASSGSSLGFGFSKRQVQGSQSSSSPEQSGTVSQQDVAVAKAVYDGLFDSHGDRAYLSWQIGAALSDAEPTYNNSTGKWALNVPSTGGLYVRKFVELLNLDNLDNLDNVTYNTLVHWMEKGMNRFYDSLQTTLPDLRHFKRAGGKLLHYHGESDPSIPAASSVHYWQAVREALYPGDEHADKEMEAFYRFYLVPGAAHCGANSLQPGPNPAASALMEQIFDWVEKGQAPSGLNATVASGKYKGETQLLCQWPKRPLWRSDSEFHCINDAVSIESWTYSLTAFRTAVY